VRHECNSHIDSCPQPPASVREKIGCLAYAGLCSQVLSVLVELISVSQGPKLLRVSRRFLTLNSQEKSADRKRYDVWRTHFDEVEKIIIEIIGSMMLDCI